MCENTFIGWERTRNLQIWRPIAIWIFQFIFVGHIEKVAFYCCNVFIWPEIQVGLGESWWDELLVDVLDTQNKIWNVTNIV
jgi:hypothetical protein